MNWRLMLSAFAAVALLWGCGKKEAPDVRIVPEPARMTIEQEMVKFPGIKKIYVSPGDSSSMGVAAYLAEKLGYSEIDYSGINPGKCIFLEVKKLEGTDNPEAYRLVSSEDGIIITGNSGRGLFYGVQTLLQLLPPEVYGPRGLRGMPVLNIPAVTIEDEPRYAWRGMHLDVGRHLYPVEFIKKYIDMLAMHKMNVFHWHLTEDQGWRIEIRKYPRLTEIGSVRKAANGGTYGGFYTQDQIREVVAYARSRFIDVMPEIEMPGHSVAALAAYPDLSCTGGPFEVRTAWGVSEDVYCAGKEETFTFIEDVLSEVVELFPFRFVHIGGDECPKVRWEKCADCQKRRKDEGLKEEVELQSYFIRRVEKFLESKNRRLVGWDEILEGGIAPSATVMSWRGVQGGIEAAKMGHDVVMSPTSHCYFDFYQGDPQFEPKAIGGYLPLEKVYSYEPTPEGLTPEEARHVLGAQGNIWTEYIPDEKQVEYMALPRMSAMAEVVWSPVTVRDYEKFTHRMVRQYQRFDQLGYRYRVPTPDPKADSFVFTDSLVIPLHNSVVGAEIRYTLDGTDPGSNGVVYTGPLVLKESHEIRAVTRMKSGHVSVPVVIRAEKQEMARGYQVAPVVQGTDYEMYQGEFSSVLQMDSVKAVSRGTMEVPGIPATHPANRYGLIFRGHIKIEKPGIYRFYLKSDDGSKLMIGSRQVVQNDGPHGFQEKSGEVALGKGWHNYELRYFQGTGAQNLLFSWSGYGMEKQAVPASSLASMASPIMMTPMN
jgi:hexosaminidase